MYVRDWVATYSGSASTPVTTPGRCAVQRPDWIEAHLVARGPCTALLLQVQMSSSWGVRTGLGESKKWLSQRPGPLTGVLSYHLPFGLPRPRAGSAIADDVLRSLHV
jgi:hypothetical protein